MRSMHVNSDQHCIYGAPLFCSAKSCNGWLSECRLPYIPCGFPACIFVTCWVACPYTLDTSHVCCNRVTTVHGDIFDGCKIRIWHCIRCIVSQRHHCCWLC